MRKRLLTWAGWLTYVMVGAGLGLVSDSLQNDIHDTGDAIYAAIRFPVLGLCVLLGQWLAGKAGFRRRSRGPRTVRAVAYLLGALAVAALAWLVIDVDAPGWRRLGLAFVVASGVLVVALAGVVSRLPASEQKA